jgi:hypothetical protein
MKGMTRNDFDAKMIIDQWPEITGQMAGHVAASEVRGRLLEEACHVIINLRERLESADFYLHKVLGFTRKGQI